MNIKRLREAHEWSQDQLAQKVGVSQTTIKKLESGESVRSRFLPEIARALGTPIEKLDESSNVQAIILPGEALSGERDLPVHGTAEAGNGAIIISTDPVDFVRRPEPLYQVRGGYGLIITGESMSPSYRPGDTVLVHPHLPPRPEDDVVLYAEDNSGGVRAILKNLIRIKPNNWVLAQYNPAETFERTRAEWQRCHVVVGKYKRR